MSINIKFRARKTILWIIQGEIRETGYSGKIPQLQGTVVDLGVKNLPLLARAMTKEVRSSGSRNWSAPLSSW
jgi:hypothetical protein